jgi:hypothetical protein
VVIRFKLRVAKIDLYFRCVKAQESRGGAKWTIRMTVWDNAMRRQALWCAKRSSSFATAMSLQNHTSE